MRVGHFTTRYPYPGHFQGRATPYRSGGAERVVATLAARQADAGHDVHVFTAGSRTSTAREDGVTVHRYRRLGAVNTTDLPPGLLVGAPRSSLDVVHAHNSTPPGVLAGALAARLQDVPFVVTHHGGERYTDTGGVLRRVGLRLYVGRMLERLLNAADAVVLPSGRYRECSTALSRVRTPVREILHGTPPADTRPVPQVRAELGIDPSRFVLTSVGVHEPRKGTDVLLEAFATIAGGEPGPLLVLMGRGSETAGLRRQGRRLGLTDAVRVPGHVAEAVKRSYLRAADVFSLPTRTAGAEMSPLVIGEAAAAGTAIVASDLPALRGVLADWGCATFVPPDDPDALARSLQDLRTAPTRMTSLARNGQEYAAATSWEAAASEYVSLYRDLEDG
ncbi:MAG: glycosyltransferase family 4 protein [Haloarculaceae archaeon]